MLPEIHPQFWPQASNGVVSSPDWASQGQVPQNADKHVTDMSRLVFHTPDQNTQGSTET